MFFFLRCCVVAVPVFIASAGPSWGAFNFSPVRLDLKNGKSVVSLTVSNTGDKPALMQLETNRWSQKGGIDVLEATEDLLAVPPVFSIPPHQTQTVRIALPGRQPVDREVSYRVFLTELPQKETDPERSAFLGVALRVSLPLFVNPQKTSKSLEWNIKAAGEKRVTVSLANPGNVHAHLKKIALLSYPDRTPLIQEKTDVFYVLPEQGRSWSFDLKDEATPSMVVVFEDVESGTQEVVLKVAPEILPQSSQSADLKK